jgi:cell division protein FtsQ
LLHWKNTLSWIAFLLFLGVLIVFVENIYESQRCKKLDIQLDTNTEGNFVTKDNINNLLTENGNKPILGSKFNKLNLELLEKNILKNKRVKSCQISRTLGGVLSVKVQQKNPIARIVSLNGTIDKFEGLYLDSEGGVFPLSNHFTKRVVLLSGKYLIGKKNLKSKKDKNIVEFIQKIDSDAFWKANITHLIIDSDQNISFLPLIGDFTIEYGIPLEEEFEPKMNKIKIFYNQIDSENNGKYKLVSVKYKNQIVCQLNENIQKLDSLRRS